MSFDKPQLRIYVSGPITSLEVDQYTYNFSRGVKLLVEHGHYPVNPLEVIPCADKSCGGKMVDGFGFLHHWTCYMRHAIKAMMECDGILMIPGWRGSRGACIEHQIAVNVGLQIRYTSDYKYIEELDNHG